MARLPIPQELLDFLAVEGTYLIVSHIDPDGDCIGSSLALGHFLERTGNRVFLLNPGPFDRTEILQYADRFTSSLPETARADEKKLRVVVLDASTLERIGSIRDEIDGFPLCVIDHHSSGQPFGDVQYIEPTSPSTSFLVQLTIEAMGHEVDGAEAEHLLFALATDTGYFRFLEENSADVFASVGRLVAAGASPSQIYYRMFGGRTFQSRKLLARMLRRTQAYCDGKLLVVWQTRWDKRLLGDDSHDSASLYQLLMTTKECEVIVYLRDVDGKSCTCSLRSSNAINVGEVAGHYGGGGHARAAGFLTPRPMKSVRRELIARFSGLLCGT